MIRFSAPAKIHLLGEHSVSYGKPALLTAINLRLTLTIKPSTKKETNIKEITNAQTAVENAIKKRFKLKKIPPYSVEITSQFPVGSGLGSSSAISATLTAALLKFLKIKSDKTLIYELATAGEDVFHGKSSGGDLSAVIFGRLLWFRKESADIKIIQPLSFEINSNLKNFYLINSTKPQESTKQMVEKVSRLKKKNPNHVEKLFSSQENLTRELTTALKTGNEKEIIRIIKDGQKNLEKLDVVGNNAKTIVKKIEKLGGCAKILGAGGKISGSGMILVYIPSAKLKSLSITRSKLKLIPIKLAQEGLRNEK